MATYGQNESKGLVDLESFVEDSIEDYLENIGTSFRYKGTITPSSYSSSSSTYSMDAGDVVLTTAVSFSSVTPTSVYVTSGTYVTLTIPATTSYSLVAMEDYHQCYSNVNYVSSNRVYLYPYFVNTSSSTRGWLYTSARWVIIRLS